VSVYDTGARVWGQLKKRPSIGVVVVGAAGLAVASVVGVGEIAIAMIAGYAAYQVLREGVSPGAAARKIIEEIAKVG
jgi:isoaspartyl peptidase/L-asparaginase-like protein (Ntn-hydrolase superfamily)